jgi:hypothetical protein
LLPPRLRPYDLRSPTPSSISVAMTRACIEAPKIEVFFPFFR